MVHFFHRQAFEIDSPAGAARFTPLHIAVITFSLSAVKSLIELGANIDAQARWTPLQGIDPGTPCSITPLLLAMTVGESGSAQTSIVEYLLASGASLMPRIQCRSCLHLAADRSLGSLQLLTAILTLGKDARQHIEDRDSDGHTALHMSVYHCDLPAVRLLLAHGADPNAPSNPGRTPYANACLFASRRHFVRTRGEVPTEMTINSIRLICDIMVQYGAQPDIKDNLGFTAQFYIDQWEIERPRNPALGVDQLFVSHQ